MTGYLLDLFWSKQGIQLSEFMMLLDIFSNFREISMKTLDVGGWILTENIKKDFKVDLFFKIEG